MKSCNGIFRILLSTLARFFTRERLTQTGAGERKKGFGRNRTQISKGESRETTCAEVEEENRLSATIAATGRGFASRLFGPRSIVASAQSVPATRLTPSATEDFTPRDLLGRQKVSLLSFFVGGGRGTRTREGWQRVGREGASQILRHARNRRISQHPFLSLSPGERGRESYSRRQTARSKTGCQRILAILSVREEENIVIVYFYDPLPLVLFLFLIYIRLLEKSGSLKKRIFFFFNSCDELLYLCLFKSVCVCKFNWGRSPLIKILK